jgi:uncharacterized protein YutE (UPF0331/DUF86 family)
MIDRSEVDRRLHAINRHIHKLEELARLDTEVFTADERLAPCAERYLHLAYEACIEIGLLLISGLRLERPRSYDDIPAILTEAGFATAQYRPHIERIIRVRDLLVHGYRGVDPQALHNQLAPRIIDLQFFSNQAALLVRRQE